MSNMEEEGSIRIAICDDHRIIVEGLQRLLADAPQTECVGTAANGKELLFLLEHVQADLVLLDLDMPVMSGIQAMARLQERHPGLKVIILTMHDEPAVVKDLLAKGADGYLLKTCGREEMLRAIHAVHEGNKHFSAQITEGLLKQRAGDYAGDERIKALSGREREILAALAEGLSNKEIGNRLFISARTVDTHRSNIMRKLEIHNLASLVRLAMETGLTKLR